MLVACFSPQFTLSHNRFGHQNIWFAKPIRIRHYTNNHITLLLVKLIRLLLQIPNVGNTLPDIWKEIDPSKAGQIIYVIDAKGNRQPTSLFYARFQVRNKRSSELASSYT